MCFLVTRETICDGIALCHCACEAFTIFKKRCLNSTQYRHIEACEFDSNGSKLLCMNFLPKRKSKEVGRICRVCEVVELIRQVCVHVLRKCQHLDKCC